jgi:hypothetical protein
MLKTCPLRIASNSTITILVRHRPARRKPSRARAVPSRLWVVVNPFLFEIRTPKRVLELFSPGISIAFLEGGNEVNG